MHRFWIEFDITNYEAPPISARMGYGVTAETLQAALQLVQHEIFRGRDLPPVRLCVDDVDVATLDARHVRPNMGTPVWPGIWFPLGYQ